MRPLEGAGGGGTSEASPRGKGGQARPAWGVADLLSGARIPLALAFVLLPRPGARLAILAVAAATDLLDGWIARRLGASRLGSVVDPVADKLFMAAAFGVVLFSGQLAWYEVVGCVLRDAVATAAFVVVALRGGAEAIPARAGGKAVTVAQCLTLLAFLLESPHLRSLAWATTAVALYAIWDYSAASRTERRRLDA